MFAGVFVKKIVDVFIGMFVVVVFLSAFVVMIVDVCVGANVGVIGVIFFLHCWCVSCEFVGVIICQCWYDYCCFFVCLLV